MMVEPPFAMDIPKVRPSMSATGFKAHGVDDAVVLKGYSRTERFETDEAIFTLGDHSDELYLLLGLSPPPVNTPCVKPKSGSASALCRYLGARVSCAPHANEGRLSQMHDHELGAIPVLSLLFFLRQAAPWTWCWATGGCS